MGNPAAGVRATTVRMESMDQMSFTHRHLKFQTPTFANDQRPVNTDVGRQATVTDADKAIPA
jgi:hypothetical protein